MVGEFGSHLRVRDLVGVVTDGVQMPGEFPDGVVAGQENRAALLQHGDAVVGRGIHALGVFDRFGVGIGSRRSLDPGIGSCLALGQAAQLVFGPQRIVIQREVRRAVRGRDGQEIGMLERPDLRVHRVAHEIEPRPLQIGVVPHLLGLTGVGQHQIEGLGIPLVAVFQNHLRGLEVAAARGGGQFFAELGQRAGALRHEMFLRRSGLGRFCAKRRQAKARNESGLQRQAARSEG